MGIYKRIIITCVCVLISLVVIDIVVSHRNNRQSRIERTFENLQELTTTNPDTETPTVTPTPRAVTFAGLPQSYKNIDISTKIYTSGFEKYKKDTTEDITTHLKDIVHRYFTYKDFLQQNNIPFTVQTPVTLSSVEHDIPPMEQLISQNLVSYMDFAYIKARFKYAPETERIQSLYGDLPKKARQIIEQYRQQLSVQNVDAEQMVEASNKDTDLMVLDNYEANEVKKHFTPSDILFFTDQHFNSFLFSQKQGTVSTVYALHGASGDEYAYLIVYPIFVQKKQYGSIDDMINDNLQYFKDY